MSLSVRSPNPNPPAARSRLAAPPVPRAAVPIRIPQPRRWADPMFRALVMFCALAVFAILGLIVYELVAGSRPSFKAFGFRFFTSDNWDPVQGDFGAWPFIYGTVVSSLLALALAVPLAVGTAVFVTELCPRRWRGVVAFLVELLASIPSVIYGLWGMFVLAPVLRVYVEPWLQKYLRWTGLFEGQPFGLGMLAAGVILAIMIVPIISSIAREVMLAVPTPQREGVLALGATQWETIRVGILRNARAGIAGAIILGLGRALGETIAVTMVIGNVPQVSHSLLAPGYTLASVIANEFNEATGALYPSALIEIGLALFLVTLIVNALAQLLVWSITRGTVRAHA